MTLRLGSIEVDTDIQGSCFTRLGGIIISQLFEGRHPPVGGKVVVHVEGLLCTLIVVPRHTDFRVRAEVVREFLDHELDVLVMLERFFELFFPKPILQPDSAFVSTYAGTAFVGWRWTAGDVVVHPILRIVMMYCPLAASNN